MQPDICILRQRMVAKKLSKRPWTRSQSEKGYWVFCSKSVLIFLSTYDRELHFSCCHIRKNLSLLLNRYCRPVERKITAYVTMQKLRNDPQTVNKTFGGQMFRVIFPYCFKHVDTENDLQYPFSETWTKCQDLWNFETGRERNVVYPLL